MGDWVSFLSGVALFFMSALVIMAYFPSRGGPPASNLLRFAIFLSFFATLANTLYWQVFGHIAVTGEWLTVSQLRFYGDYLDLIFKGGAAFAGWLHLKSIKERIAEQFGAEEARKWTVLEMSMYPRRIGWLQPFLKPFRR